MRIAILISVVSCSLACGGKVTVPNDGSGGSNGNGASGNSSNGNGANGNSSNGNGANGNGAASGVGAAGNPPTYTAGVGALYDDYPGDCVLGCGEYLAGYSPISELCGDSLERFEALSTCVCEELCVDECSLSCGVGAADDGCEACVDANCGPQNDACQEDI